MLKCGDYPEVSKKPDRALTRRDFLRAAGAGAAGASLLGAAGCSGFADKVTRLPEEYLPGGGAGPNVILVIIDSLRRDHVGAYGNPWIHTPTLDAIAAESLRFTHAQPEAMPTLPARRAVYTGMRTWPTSPPHFGWTSIPLGQRTLAEILEGKGYGTYLVTDTYVQFPENFGRGFRVNHEIRGQENDTYRDPDSVDEKVMQEQYIVLGEGKKARQYLANVKDRAGEAEYFAPRVFSGATRALESAVGENKPFFLVADCYDPHEPWDPPEEYVALYDTGYEGKEPLADNYGKDDYLTDRQLLRMRALYSAEVTMVDRWLGKFVERAHELGVMENTLLVVLSDHGHCLGEHGYTGQAPLRPLSGAHRRRIHDPTPRGHGRWPKERLLRLHPRRGAHHPQLPRGGSTRADGRAGPGTATDRRKPRTTQGPHNPGLLPLHLRQGRTQGDVLPQRHDRRPPLRRRKRRGPEKRPCRSRARDGEEDVRRVRPERSRRTPSEFLKHFSRSAFQQVSTSARIEG